MNDLVNAIGEAWEKVKVRLMEDDGELRRRLKRRWGVLARPPRAWCLAVRASDTRITPTHALITPEWALDVRQCDGGVIADHTVRLDSRLLRETVPAVSHSVSGAAVDGGGREAGGALRDAADGDEQRVV